MRASSTFLFCLPVWNATASALLITPSKFCHSCGSLDSQHALTHRADAWHPRTMACAVAARLSHLQSWEDLGAGWNEHARSALSSSLRLAQAPLIWPPRPWAAPGDEFQAGFFSCHCPPLPFSPLLPADAAAVARAHRPNRSARTESCGWIALGLTLLPPALESSWVVQGLACYLR